VGVQRQTIGVTVGLASLPLTVCSACLTGLRAYDLLCAGNQDVAAVLQDGIRLPDDPVVVPGPLGQLHSLLRTAASNKSPAGTSSPLLSSNLQERRHRGMEVRR
jgi:hypothetical protein